MTFMERRDRQENLQTGKDQPTVFYFVRHGTTEWNQKKRYQGHADNPLDEMGERQGALLAEYFRDIPLDLAVTSPLKRAVQTLEYALSTQPREVPVIFEPGVMEIDFGDADGLVEGEIRERYPEFYRTYVMGLDRGHAQAPGGESVPDVYRRMRDSIMRVAREHPGKNVIVTSHGSAIQTFLNFAAGHPEDQIDRIILVNVAVSCVAVDPDGTPHILYIGDKHHVPEELQFSYGPAPKA